MADILSVEVGDRFKSVLTQTVVEVIKVWFEFSIADERWETSVIWVTEPMYGDSFQVSAKGREFVQKLKDGAFIRVEKVSSSSVATAPLSSSDLTGTTATISTDPKRKQWEDDFRRHAARYGLSPTDLGRMIRLGGSRSRNYTIVGAKPRNYKMPILVKGARGGIYKITVEKAKVGLA